ncbi:MAG: exosome complex RNA-binding protein Csl4 [Archaeoglobaceae archaeon]|uniref:Exosome complex component Csl4 n=1 Tax=Archaeoglobus fulgidus TaxID=2234 RepID=A0A7J3M1B3_ARCFL
MKERIVFPGDRIGTVEEFKAGKGVYEENREIYAGIAGYLEIRDNVANVVAFKKIPELKKDDVVIGRVVDVRNNFAMVEIARKRGEDRDLGHTNLAMLHISNVGRFESITNALSYRDIVKARVLDATPKLSIKEPEMGVVKAFCSVCKADLILEKGKLKCPNCGREESRKLSSSYGKGEW